jgi:hypothetical protein
VTQESQEDDDDRALVGALEAYRVPEAPTQLADRVLERIRRPALIATSRWRRIALVSVLAAAAAMATVLAIGGRAGETTMVGRHVASGRESVALGTRAIAVAEARASVRWTIAASGDVRVVQSEGNVFYRVEPGGEFFVDTPSGTVQVTGTCFRVEIQPMKLSRETALAAGIGAVLATITVVTVYEGHVRLVNPRGSVALGAGHRGRADPTAPPTHDADPPVAGSPTTPSMATAAGASQPDATGRDLVAQNLQLHDDLDAARRQISALESKLAEARGGRPSRVDPTRQQLADWAANCEIHLDAPGVFGASTPKLDAKLAADWGLTSSEQPVIEQSLAELFERTRREMREIYVSATGNASGADELTAGAMLNEVENKVLPSDELQARRRLARERGGLQAPPANPDAQPPIERALRLLYRLGNDFERMLGESLTPARAHELRKHYDSWPGVHIHDSGCEERVR